MSDGRTAEPPGRATITGVVVLPRPRGESVIWGAAHPATTLHRRRSGWPENDPKRPLRLHDSWLLVAASGLLATLTLAVALWIATHVRVDPQLHTAGLFVHLASLVLGFGGVLIADYLMLLWLAGRSTVTEALTGMGRLHFPIWAGLAGLIASGCVLEPNLGSALTRTKMALILVLTLNGLQAMILSKRLSQQLPAPISGRLLLWGAASGAISQICWWGAIGIGFWNSQH
ncbi:hypothetical protein [Nocardia sp. NPDC050710]|uniref:hypothetical protein n=1 Tax=Nocardia sp. NPDC050710 TaxID=3157220 RepID=UPI00340FF31D